MRWHNEDAVSVVANSAVTMLSEGGVGCSVKWGKKLYYGDVVASGKQTITTTNYSMIIHRNEGRYGTARNGISNGCYSEYLLRTLVPLKKLKFSM